MAQCEELARTKTDSIDCLVARRIRARRGTPTTPLIYAEPRGQVRRSTMGNQRRPRQMKLGSLPKGTACAKEQRFIHPFGHRPAPMGGGIKRFSPRLAIRFLQLVLPGRTNTSPDRMHWPRWKIDLARPALEARVRATKPSQPVSRNRRKKAEDAVRRRR